MRVCALLARPASSASCLEQARTRTICQKPTASLAARAVITFILCIDDSLDRSAAYTTGLTVTTVHRHPSRKALTFSGKESPTSIRSFSIQYVSVSTAARYRRVNSSPESMRVCLDGDSLAANRASSEYEFPMPLMIRGSMSACLSVWFSFESASRNPLPESTSRST